MKHELDTLLHDPRCHRAVADLEMSERVAARVLRRHAAQSAAARGRDAAGSATPAARPARGALARWLRPAAVRTRWGLAGAARTRWVLAGAAGAAVALGALLLAARLGWIRRVDLLAKHWLADLADGVRAGLLFAPVMTALFLAGLACLAGFAALPGARRGWRLAFGG